MAGINEAKRSWVANALGVTLADGADGAAPGRHARKSHGGKDAEDPAKPARHGQDAAPTDAVGKLAALLKALNDEADALDKAGFGTTEIFQHHDELEERAATAAKNADADARGKTLAALEAEAQDALDHAKSLSRAAKDVMGKGAEAPSAEQKSAIYRKALEEHYHLTIDVPPDMKNTHFDKVFAMFGSVPKSHVAQDRMKKLTYKPALKGGEYGDAEIALGDFGTAKKSEEYEVNGEKLAANDFKVTTLHEIGHSIDDKQSIMKSNMGSEGCGKWQSENISKITAAFLPELRRAAAVPADLPDRLVSSLITGALIGNVAKPGIVADADWARILPWLNAHCTAIRHTNEPWEKPPVAVAGRVYHQANESEWWSYDHGARAKTRVSDYQFRSPWEWFAEIYAITWLAKRKPPSGVDAKVAAFMWNEG